MEKRIYWKKLEYAQLLESGIFAVGKTLKKKKRKILLILEAKQNHPHQIVKKLYSHEQKLKKTVWKILERSGNKNVHVLQGYLKKKGESVFFRR